MGRKKTEQKQQAQQSFQNTNQHGWETPPDTQDTQSFRNWQPQSDPGLGFQYANARERLKSSFQNPLGSYQTPGMSEAIQRNEMRRLGQDEAQAFRQGAYDRNQQQFGQKASLASMTQPRLVNTGSSGTGSSSGTSTTTQSGDLLGQILGATAMVGSAAMGNPAGIMGGKNKST